jgi:hypothetical protein
MKFEEDFLESAKKQFLYYKQLGDKTFNQLTEDELNWTPHPDSNSINTIVRHLVGNMLSRWTDFLNSDGEKSWRNRDEEFESFNSTKAELLSNWEKGWSCLFEALNTLNNANLDSVIYIRNEGHSIVEAINRQLSHYPFHVGQIVFIGKLIKGSDWNSLSIPKGNSEMYNASMFAKDKRKTNFIDGILTDEKRS